MKLRSAIISTGSFVPDNVIDNADLKQFRSDLLPLIEQKTGVKSRRFADETQCTSDLAIMAAQRCLQKINGDPAEIDAIILATSSPDRIQPATATRLQNEIGAKKAFAFDVNSVCSGGVFSLHVADSLIRSGFCKHVLVVAAEIYSRFLNQSDFSTFPYFGDGAGAVLLSPQEENDRGIIKSLLKTNGSGADLIQIPAGGSMLPYQNLKNSRDVYFKMVGREVYEFAVNQGSEIIQEILVETAIDRAQLKYIISHQANLNIIKELSKRTNIDESRFVINLDKYGNTAGASIFIGLDELIDSGQVREGDLILLVAFGGGLSWGATLIRY